jgi:choline kinase
MDKSLPKVVILTAGMGSRLGDPNIPKPLTLLDNHKSILGYQIENIAPHISLNNIFLVVGFSKEKIMEQFPHFLFVYNPSFAKENTSKSLLRALNKIETDVLWINGDVVFHPSIIEKILSFDKTCMVVNVCEVGEEEVKYSTEAQGKILEVSKKVSKPEGEALGINFFKAKDVPKLQEALERCADTDYFEKAIEICIKEGTEVWSLPIHKELCTEVDFPEDLVKANQLLKSW